MHGDQSTGALKTFVKVVGLTILVSALSILVLNAHETRVGGYLFCGVIAFFGWRMIRKWDKCTVQVYSLTQSIMTGIVVGMICNHNWPHTGYGLGGFVVLIFGSKLERFLVRYTGFSGERPVVERGGEPPNDVTGTPWQNNPSHVT